MYIVYLVMLAVAAFMLGTLTALLSMGESNALMLVAIPALILSIVLNFYVMVRNMDV